MRTMPDKKPKPKDRPENPAARELAEAMFRAAETQPRGQFDTGVDAGRNDAALKRAELGRPGRLRVRSLAAFAALLALPLQAQAQNAGICGRTDRIVVLLIAATGHNLFQHTCADVTDAHLAAVTHLYLWGIDSLAEGDFDGLTALTELLLNPNDLTTLPAGVFDKLTKLTYLDLGVNDLTTLPAGVFDKLTELTYLDLSFNALTALPAGVFDELTSLTDLDLKFNALTALPAGVFDELTALTTLELHNNSLTTLPAGVFDELTALEKLPLHTNSLTTLPAGVFDKLTALTTLELQGNSLSTLPDDVFEELTALTDLRLFFNPGAPFSPTANALPDDGTVLVGPGGTVTLDGSGSDGGPWGTNVTYSWRQTSGPTTGVTFDDATSAKPVVTIPALTDGTELTFTLTVTGRGFITDRFGTPSTAPDTDTATVMAEFDSTAGICGRTEEVRDAIVGKISGVASCAYVTDTHLAAITGSLSLFNKGITALAAGDFDELTALTELSLSNNALSTLPAGVFDDLTALTTLNLHTNSLSTLPAGVFDELTALTALFLGFNSLSTLPAGVFDELTALTQLNLHNNSLTTLPDDVFEPLTALTALPLQGNPGAPFAPTADALPDDGTVLPAGGTVTLDGSGSDGGPWGTNVTYFWKQTSGPTSGVTFDDATSAKPVVTIPALTDRTELTFTLTVNGRGANTGIVPDTDTDTATVTVFDPAAGICGRTKAVRDELVNVIGVTTCADVTDAHLAAITRTLDLHNKGITALAAGDFDGLTALTELSLSDNSLTTLPDDVFDELTELTLLSLVDNSLSTLDDGVFDNNTALGQLFLTDNSLETLPDDVFDNNIVLWNLWLDNNSLSTLPDDVFEPLHQLARMNLGGNPGVPFAPTADALPDDGEVSPAGGTVTLDGSGSDGGPWGTNVFYFWALTSPASGVTVTYDDHPTNAKPVVTIPALTAGAELTFTLTVTGRGAGTGTAPDTDTAIVTAMVSNTAPNATDATVSTDEDAAYDFDAGDFNFTDTDTGDTLASVKITSLPASGKGSLTLDGSAVSANQVVSRADIDADKLVYTPPANANGDDYASFGFKVSDGTDETTSAYTMTIDVTAVNDAATGAPAISGTARVGSELTAAEGTIADVDGLTSVSYSYQWIRVDGTDEMDITGAASSTYTLVAADQGKKVKVRLGFTDDDGTGEARTSAAYPDGTVTAFDPTAGICGRTEAVRIAILALISDVTNCADVTDAHLTAITGTLDLVAGTSSLQAGDFDGLTALTVLDMRFNNLASLPDGVFDELTALTDLDLGFNSLTTLPAGVFDELTALTGLGLNDNSLTTLPAGVFDELPALTGLGLNDNSLTTLPAGVFDELTALTLLWLQGNPGAPFAPTAVALPDDGTVSNAGGTVTLDGSGSGSGGPWGTNVTYSWSQTSGPTSGVTFDDATSAKPVVTIPALTDGAELTFTLTVTGRGGSLGAAPDTDTATVTATAPPASDDATLESLTVSDGTSDLTLDPTFASATTSYAAEVANAVTTVTLTAMTTDDGASVSAVTLNGNAIADSDFTDGITVPSLLVGDNDIVVTVTAEDTSSTQTYTVTVTRTNSAPTASDGSVTTDEDTAHTFAEDEFNFADPDAGDALASVRVVTLPAAGALALDGTSVTVGQAVPAAKIGDLVFTPEANANGTGYASFTFRVSDGTDESALAYAMTVNVTAVDDPATGGPTISGTSQVGQILTAATTGIADVDGLTSPTYGYQWIRVDDDGTSNATDVAGETADTYTLMDADVGKKIRVKVSFTDHAGGDEELTSDAYPSNGTIEAAPNAAPAFTSSATFDAAENQTAVGTVTATDSDGDSVTGYTIAGGADQAAFSIVALTGVLTFTAAPNFEAPTDADDSNTYEVLVRATSGTDARVKTADQPITVTVTDVDTEAPGVPAKPTVTSASVTSVTVTWAAPSNEGPAITSYDLQYRIMGTSGAFTVGPQDVSGPSEPIPGLAEDTEYEVQVRATNAEGDSDWSEAGSGSTDANAAPAFTSSATFDAAENQTAVGTVTATDSDGDSVTGYAIAGGADQAAFSIVALTGVLTFTAAPNFEAPTDADGSNTYEVLVRATSGTGARVKTADQPITVTVTDVDTEAPGVPAKPTVTSASVTSVTVTWAAPSNEGPAITSYDLQYRIMGTSGAFTVGPQDVSGPSEPIPGLAEDTEYEVQVRATNAEGDSDWSEAGSGSTDANAAPAFTSSATFDAAENQTAVGTVTATDSDGDSVTGYTIAGGADQAAFSIVALTGVLTFTAAPNFEAPTDADDSNTYEVLVRATSGTGARVKTADQPITVTVTDVDTEAPGVPAKPTVTSASVTSVTVTWAAPSNEGPAITSYDLQYRIMGTSGAFTVGPQDVSGPSEPIPGLAEDTEYEVQVRATNAEGDSDWSEAGSGSTDANAAPAFTSSATFDAAENQTAVGTVTATDSDGDSVTGYTIAGGADQAAFSIVALTGVLTFTAAPNFEAPTDADDSNTYEVLVRATSGTDARVKTADQPITVTVTDVDTEAPGVPAKPTVTSASVTSVTVTWAAPSNEGPAITSYDLQYRIMGTSGAFTVGPQDVSGPSEPIPGLAEDTEYEVQVRATNAEGDSDWSEAGSGSTDANAAPAFTSSATFDAAENQTAVGTVTATDSDGDSVTGYAIAGGADQAAFSIVALTGVLTFTAAPNFEAPTDADDSNTYEVLVRATSGTGARVKTADQPITVTVTDVDTEAPGVPAKPTVTSASVTSVTVTWAAPSNEGPAITSYDLQYRIMGTSGAFTVGPQDVSGPSEPIPGLAEDTEYEVQVRATNAEGDSDWSEAGSGSTDANAAPAFTSSATFDAAENQTAVGTVTATDSDGDSVTGYTIAGGADQAAFSIVALTGVLTFTAAPNFEAPTDADDSNTYEVLVRATSGTGARVKTADQPITVTVTDVDTEAPGVPAKPTVTSASVTSVTVTWAAPSNEGPAITSYDLQYRIMGTSGAFTVGPQDVSGPSEPIPGLAEDTEYEVQVRATNAEGDSDWSEAGSGSTDANAAPAFTSSATFDAAENQTAVGTVTATDSDGDSVTGYTIAGGADQAAFSIVALTGVLTFTAAPNFEAPTDADDSNTYEVLVRATSGTGARVKTADQPITVTVTDVDTEAPGVPAKPTVTSASVTSVTVTWAAPSNEGPAITSYDLQYRIMGTSGAFTVGPQDVSGPSEPIPGLAEDTEYEVQVRATNAEGDSDWSEAGSGSTDANAAPAFTSSATFDAAENQTAVGTVTATDSDGDSVTGYTIAGGADQAAFSIVALTGVLTFTAAPNFEAPTDADDSNTYEVLVRATSGTGARVKTADQPITVTVTDVDTEAPGVPAKPTVTSASVTSVTVTWAAPSNEGPAITSYDLQYRIMGTSGAFTVGPQDVSGPSEPIPGLAEDTEYEVQVRATNAEGDSDWSEAGSGSTDANAAPAFTSSATFDAAENQTAVGTVTATDSDGDSVTGYTIAGGADQAAFSIVALTGVLTFTAAPNFEAPTDADDSNTYEVLVRATSGTGARVKTADQPITVTVTDVDTEAPGVPAKPTVTSASVTSVTVTWAAPSNEGPAITSYDLQYRIMGTSGAFTVGPQDVSGPSEPIPGLAEDTEYEVQVRATNAEGDSDWSEAGSGSTDATPGVTVSTTALTVTEGNTTGGSYTVVLDSQPTASVTVTVAGHARTDVTPTPTSLTFTTSNWNTAQPVTVTAGTDADTTGETVTLTHSAASADSNYNGITIAGVTVTVTDNDDDTPQVTRVAVTPGNERLVVSWTAVGTATGYKVQWKSGNESYNTGDRQATITQGSSQSHTIAGLANGTKYTVRVTATRTGAADGPPSTEVTGTPERVPSDRPTVFIEAVEGTVTEGEPARFRVRLSQTWATTVYVRLDGRETERMVSGNTNVSRTFTPTGPGGRVWRIVEIATDDDDWREAASELTMRVVPGRGDYTVDETATATVRIEDNDQAVARTPDVPQRVEAIPGDGRVTLVWEPPHSDGGQTITRYEYRARHTSPFGAAGTTGETWVSMDSARSSYVVGDLDNDVQGQVTVYVFQLRAVNAEGAGDPSREARARPMPYAQRPGSPRDLTAVGNADGSVTLHWEAPVTDGGSDITHYEYIAEESFSAREGPAVSVTVTWASTGSNAPGVTASHRNGSGPTSGEVLSGGVTYAFAVRAVNAKGPSPLFSNRAWAMPTAEPAARRRACRPSRR